MMVMIGSRSATVQQVQVLDIHGTKFYDLWYHHDDEPATERRARLGPEAVYTTIQPGDAVEVSYMMGIATSIKRQ